MGRTQRKRRQKKQLIQTNADNKSNGRFPYDLFMLLGSFGWKNNTKLAIKNYQQFGLGLYSKANQIWIGQELIRLPSDCLISIVTLEKDEKFKSQFDTRENCVSKLSFQSLISLYLLYQRHLEQLSPWWPYVRSLPDKLTMPYFCAINELPFLPDLILEQIVQKNREILNDFHSFQNVFSQKLCKCCGKQLNDIYNLENFKWAFFITNSRSIFVPNSEECFKANFFKSFVRDEINLGLAPFLDLFNHSDAVETSVELKRNSFNHFDYILSLKENFIPIKKKNSQIFISYGKLTNLKLLIEYGFTLPVNNQDNFQFSLNDIENFINSKMEKKIYNNKLKFIKEHNLHKEMFVDLQNGNSHNLNVVLNILFNEETNFWKNFNKLAFGSELNLKNMKSETSLLISFIITQYLTFISDIGKINNLTESGKVILDYLEKCISYLKNV